MILFSAREKILVQKARKPWKVTRTKSRMMALGKAMSSAVVVGYKSGIKKFKSKIPKEEVYQAWLSGNYSRVFEAIPWAQLPGDLEKYSDSLLKAAGMSSAAAIESVPAPIGEALRFDTKNAAIKNLIDDNTGRMVEGIQEGTREFLADAVARRFDEALSPRDVADLIQPSIGINSRQVIALANYRNMLSKQGLSDARIETMSDSYYERLLDYRAMMVARTETRIAMNQGQLSVWNAAADQGLIERDKVSKKWVVDGDPCERCIELGDEGPIGLDESWTSDEDTVDSPPLHPNCYCDMELVFESKPEEID